MLARRRATTPISTPARRPLPGIERGLHPGLRVLGQPQVCPILFHWSICKSGKQVQQIPKFGRCADTPQASGPVHEFLVGAIQRDTLSLRLRLVIEVEGLCGSHVRSAMVAEGYTRDGRTYSDRNAVSALVRHNPPARAATACKPSAGLGHLKRCAPVVTDVCYTLLLSYEAGCRGSFCVASRSQAGEAKNRVRDGALARRLPRRPGYSLGTATWRHPRRRPLAPVGGSLGGQGTRATSHSALPSTAPRRPTPALGRPD